ncbi:MAG: PQQ-binding-like beta-propeller repeat protein [Planctomycetes bacterium]|nr:PQQ-binding-like beta-propeller repeat protein [Planctomycetota bacterium]
MPALGKRSGKSLSRPSSTRGVFLFKWGRQGGVQGGVQGMLLSPDQKTLFIADTGRVVAYDLKTGKQIHVFPIAVSLGEDPFGNRFGQEQHFAMAVTSDGKTLAVPAQAAVAFWNVETGKEIHVVNGHRDQVDSVAFGPGGMQALTGAADGRLLLWDAAGGQQLREFPFRHQLGTNHGHTAFAFSPDNRFVALTGSPSAALKPFSHLLF